MKKNLIAAAALVAFAGAASAQTTVYGLVDMCYGKSLYSDIIKQDAQFHSGGDNDSSECNSTTRVGVKGTYDLGGGVKANLKFETNGVKSSGAVNNGGIVIIGGTPYQETNGALFGRQAWFGLSGGFGEVRVGRQDSVVFQTMIDFDFNGASNGVSAGAYSGVGVFLPGRQSGVLNYIAPAMGGFTAQVGYQPKGAVKTQYGIGTGEKDVVSLGLKYAAGPVAAGFAYQSKKSDNSKDFSSVAGTYDFGVAKVMVGYANGGDIAQGGSGKGPTLGVTFPLAGWTLGGIYSNNTDDNAKIKSYELFLNKEIFKNTYGYLEGGNSKSSVGTSPSYQGYAAGVIFVF